MSLDDLAATASAAPAARRLRGLVQWVGEGRPLTQTGRLRRADALALALAELLDTGDRLEPRFPIHSSAGPLPARPEKPAVSGGFLKAL